MTFHLILRPSVGADYAVSKLQVDDQRSQSSVLAGLIISPSSVSLSRSEGSLARGVEMLRGVDTEQSACAQHDCAVTQTDARITVFLCSSGPPWAFLSPQYFVKLHDWRMSSTSASSSATCWTFCTLDNLPSSSATSNRPTFRSPIIGNANSLTLDPARATDPQSTQVVSMLYTGLVSLDDNLNVQDRLASFYDLSSDSLTWTFHIRSDLKFSDGTRLTAHDVAYSIDRALQPTTNSAHCMAYLGLIKYADQLHAGSLPSLINQSLLVPDGNTLVIQLSKPPPYFLSDLAYPCSYVVEKHPIDLYGSQKFTTRVAEGGGSGPFRVAQYYPGRQLDLLPNPLYAGPQPQLKNVIFHFYKDITASYQVRTNYLLKPYVAGWRANAASLSPPNDWSNIYITAQRHSCRLKADRLLNNFSRVACSRRNLVRNKWLSD
jgi:hypothetical protein